MGCSGSPQKSPLRPQLMPMPLHSDIEVLIFKKDFFKAVNNISNKFFNDQSSLGTPVASSAYCSTLISVSPILIPRMLFICEINLVKLPKKVYNSSLNFFK